MATTYEVRPDGKGEWMLYLADRNGSDRVATFVRKEDAEYVCQLLAYRPPAALLGFLGDQVSGGILFREAPFVGGYWVLRLTPEQRERVEAWLDKPILVGVRGHPEPGNEHRYVPWYVVEVITKVE